MDGLLIVDKPSGPTSHDVVARMRRVLREKRIGHTGTLDPMATGVLVLVVGKATRLAKFLSASDKSYEAIVRFGFATDTADAQGRPVGPVTDGAAPAREAIDAALEAFRGTFMQQPPTYSAKKIDGQRSYKAARARASVGSDETPAGALPAPTSVTTPSRCAWTAPPASTSARSRTTWANGWASGRISPRFAGPGLAASGSIGRCRSTRQNGIQRPPNRRSCR